MIRSLIRSALVAPLVLVATLAAQNPPPQSGSPPGGPPPRGRPLDDMVRTQLSRVLRTQVGLTESQLQRVQDLNTRLDGQRRQFNQDESRVRQSLRDEVMMGDSTRNATVGELLDRLIRIERQRSDLFEQEHRELAQFMTPMQRAKYMGVQEAVRRRVQELLAEQQGDQQEPPGRGRGGPNRKRPEP